VNWATPLYLSAIAVAIGFRMNLFNIGVEGQYILAAFMAAQVGAIVSLPPVLHVGLIILTAMVVGAFWAGLAGLMKVTRNVHEVIGTIMLNGIAVGGIVSYLLGLWDVPDDGLDTALGAIPQSGWFPSLSPLLERSESRPAATCGGSCSSPSSSDSPITSCSTAPVSGSTSGPAE
jgi:general nucleoside transport system permease protein